MKYFIAITFFLTVGCFLLAAGFGAAAGEDTMNTYWEDAANSVFTQPDGKFVYSEESYDAGAAEELAVTSTEMDIKFEKSDSDKIQILYYKDKNASQPSSIVNGSVANINLDTMAGKKVEFKFNFHKSNFGMSVQEASAKILVPARIKRIKIKTSSGDVKISGLSTDDVKIETVSGDSRIETSRFGGLEVQSISGNLKAEAGIQKIKVHTVSGDVKFVSQLSSPEAKFATTSGDVRISFEKEADINLKFDTTSGALSFDKGSERTQIEGSIKDLKLGKGGGKFEIQTVSGDLEIVSAN